MIPSATSRPVFGYLSIGAAVAVLLSPAGCLSADGFFVYHYTGEIVDADTKAPVVDAEAWAYTYRMLRADLEAIRTRMEESGSLVRTNEEGKFSGTYVVDGWGYTVPIIFAPLARPPKAPAVDEVIVFVRQGGVCREVIIPLDKECQKNVSPGKRHLMLGRIVLPPPTPDPPADPSF